MSVYGEYEDYDWSYDDTIIDTRRLVKQNFRGRTDKTGSLGVWKDTGMPSFKVKASWDLTGGIEHNVRCRQFPYDLPAPSTLLIR